VQVAKAIGCGSVHCLTIKLFGLEQKRKLGLLETIN